MRLADWVTGSGHWAMGGRAGGHLPGWTWETRARQGRPGRGQAGQGMAGNRAGTGSWALGGGNWEQQNSAQAPRQPKPTGPTRWGWPKEPAGWAPAGRVPAIVMAGKAEERDSGVLCARGRAAKFGPASHSDDSRHGPAHSSRHQRETRYPSWPRHPLFLPLAPPSFFNPVPGFLSQSKTPIAHCKLGN